MSLRDPYTLGQLCRDDFPVGTPIEATLGFAQVILGSEEQRPLQEFSVLPLPECWFLLKTTTTQALAPPFNLLHWLTEGIEFLTALHYIYITKKKLP